MRVFSSIPSLTRVMGVLLLMQIAIPGVAFPAHAGGRAAASAIGPSADASLAAAKASVAVPDDGEENFSVVKDEDCPAGENSPLRRLIGFAGRLHPVLTHFPVAWILLAAGLEWAALLIALRHSGARRFSAPDGWQEPERARRLGTASLILLGLSAASTLAAAGSGYLLSLSKEPEAALTLHSRLAYATLTLGMLALGARLLSRKWSSRAWRLASALLLAAAAATVGYAGHVGGSLVYGEGYPLTSGAKP